MFALRIGKRLVSHVTTLCLAVNVHFVKRPVVNAVSDYRTTASEGELTKLGRVFAHDANKARRDPC